MPEAAAQPLAVCFHKFGPYHRARIRATGAMGSVVALEASSTSGIYAWNDVDLPGVRRITWSPDRDPRAESPTRLLKLAGAALRDAAPRVVAINGYSDPSALAMLLASADRGTPRVLFSATHRADHARRAAVESVKRPLVRSFHAAVVGGSKQAEYLVDLGFPADRIVHGYDVVDHDAFVQGAAAARAAEADWRARLALPARYFLCSARFVAKKNLGVLLEAFARDLPQQAEPWDLVMLGDGAERATLEAQAAALGIAGRVHFPGFRQADELPAFYAFAGALVLPSITEPWGLVANEAAACRVPSIVSDRCGCAPDLIENAVTGFVFPCGDVDALAAHLARIRASEDDRRRLGDAAFERVSARFTPTNFAEALWQAAEWATGARNASLPLSTRLLARALMARRVTE